MALKGYIGGVLIDEATDFQLGDDPVEIAYRDDAGTHQYPNAIAMPPAGVEASVDGGQTYGAAPAIGTIAAANVSVWYRKAQAFPDPPAFTDVVYAIEHDPAELIPDVTPPSQVLNLVAVGGDTQVSLTWDAATDDTAVDHYEVQVSTNGVDWSDLDLAVPGTSKVHSGLGYEVTRYYRVRAVDAAGNAGAYSATATATTNADTTAPTLSGVLSATPGDTLVSLDWPDATDNVAVDHYNVEYKLASEPSVWTPLAPDPSVSNAIVPGLTNGLAYDFRVNAEDAEGNVSGYLTANATPQEVNVNPAAFTPTVRFDNGDEANNRVTVLAGTTDPQGGTLTYRYAVTPSPTPPADWGPYSANESTAPSGNATFFVVSGLTPATFLWPHVRCTDAQGNSIVVTGELFFYDTYARSDGPVGTAYTKLGTTNINISNQRTITGSPYWDALYGIAGLSAETDGIIVHLMAASNTGALFIRATDLANHYRLEATSTSLVLTRVVGGTPTVLKTITGLSNGANTFYGLKAVDVGNGTTDLALYTGTNAGNGLTLRGTHNDASPIASGYPGIGQWSGVAMNTDNLDYRRL